MTALGKYKDGDYVVMSNHCIPRILNGITVKLTVKGGDRHYVNLSDGTWCSVWLSEIQRLATDVEAAACALVGATVPCIK